MGYGMQIPAHRVGGPKKLWDFRVYGLSESWVKRVPTVPWLIVTPMFGRSFLPFAVAEVTYSRGLLGSLPIFHWAHHLLCQESKVAM